MKKILISALALALPALASAQVQLIGGYNFGQFLSAGAPSLDGTTGDPVGSVGSNFRLNSQAPSSSSGDFVAANGLTGDYSTGFGRLYWDGSNGSTAYNFSNGTSIVANDSFGANSVNGQTVQGYSLSLQGDGGNLALTTAVPGGTLAFIQNTSGFADFDPTAFANGPGVVSDANLTFAASVTAPVSVTWTLLGSAWSTVTNLSGAAMTSYSVDLPPEFYGQAGSQLMATFSGTASIDNVNFNAVVAIPEPSTYAMLLGAATLAVVALRRRKQALSLS